MERQFLVRYYTQHSPEASRQIVGHAELARLLENIASSLRKGRGMTGHQLYRWRMEIQELPVPPGEDE